MENVNTCDGTPSPEVLRQFGLDAGQRLALLSGGSTSVFRVGDVVLKRIKETSLENDHSPELSAWMSDFSSQLHEEGFRVSHPLMTVDHAWITEEGWTAMTYVEGRHATRDDIPACIEAIRALHKALKPMAKHPLMDANRTAWGKAHRWCWGEKPDGVQPELRPLVDRLYALRRPVEGLEWQLIHADLNHENILVAPGLAPAFLDLSPFWAPPEFALAIFANFAGPRRGDASILKHFAGVQTFDQLLIRAGIRMLLVVSALNGLDEWSSERRAAELIIEQVPAM
jgi:Ser/Thr protein kinase RdoA (MazF antagonist)